MFKSKVIFPLLVLVSVLVSYSDSIASGLAPPHPICAINATVLDVKKARQEIIFDEPHTYVDYHAVKLKIHNSTIFKNEEYSSCNHFINSEIDSILRLSEYDKSPIKTGEKINANIVKGGDQRFHGYFLSDIKILNK